MITSNSPNLYQLIKRSFMFGIFATGGAGARFLELSTENRNVPASLNGSWPRGASLAARTGHPWSSDDVTARPNRTSVGTASPPLKAVTLGAMVEPAAPPALWLANLVPQSWRRKALQLSPEQLQKAWELDPHDAGAQPWNLGIIRAACSTLTTATSDADAMLAVNDISNQADMLLEQNGAFANAAAAPTTSPEVAAAAYTDMAQAATALELELSQAIATLQGLSNGDIISPPVYTTLLAQLTAVLQGAQQNIVGYTADAARAQQTTPVPTATLTPAATPTLSPPTSAPAMGAAPPPSGIDGECFTPAGLPWDCDTPWSTYYLNVNYTNMASPPTTFAQKTATMQPQYSYNFKALTALPAEWQAGNDAFHGGNGELEVYTPAQVTVVPGTGLVLTAIKTAEGTYASGKVYAMSPSLNSAPSGALEFQAILPQGCGLWPAFWGLPAGLNSASGDDSQWPVNGERDTVEIKGRKAQSAHGTLHWGDTPDSDNAVGGIYNGGTANYADGKPHTFANTWDAHGTQWYVDGQMYANITYGDFPPHVTQRLSLIFTQPFGPIVNLAVGGKFDPECETGAAIDQAGTVFPANLTLLSVTGWSA